jgi:putative aldouronate transport system permease protein
MKQSTGEKIFQWGNVLLLTLLGLITLYPFIYVLSLSLSTAAEAQRSGLHLYPQEVSLTAYKMVLNNPNILIGYLNSIFRTVTGTLGTLVFTCLCAYPLSRQGMRWRRTLTFIVLFTLIFNGGLVPMYLQIRNLGLLNNRLVYILPSMVAAFNVIVLKNFFEEIPNSLAEAARIDGASEWRILFQIYVPLAKPALATISLWTAVVHWNQWFDAMIYITDDKKQVLQNFLQRIVVENSTDMIAKGLVNPDIMQFTPETIKAATVIITILPMIIAYPFIQKYFVKGIMIGGVKE